MTTVINSVLVREIVNSDVGESWELAKLNADFVIAQQIM